MIQFNNIRMTNNRIYIVKDLNFTIADGELFALVTLDSTFYNHLYNLVKGYHKTYSGTIEASPDTDSSIAWFEGAPSWHRELKTAVLFKTMKKLLYIDDEFYAKFWTQYGSSFSRNIRMSDLKEWEQLWLAFILFVLKKRQNYIFHDVLKGQSHELKTKVLSVFNDLKQEKQSILYLTDDLFLAAEIADRIGLIKDGRLETIYTKGELNDIGLERAYKTHL